jgi:hypothetical protein
VVLWSEFMTTDPQVRVRLPALPDFLRSDRHLSAKLMLTFADGGVLCSQRDRSLRPHSRFSKLEPLLFLPSSSLIVITMLSGPSPRPTISQQIW